MGKNILSMGQVLVGDSHAGPKDQESRRVAFIITFVIIFAK